jgi:hypothetical protein
MESNRRSFFRTLLAPLVTFILPKPSLYAAIDEGINPDWDGAIRLSRGLDEINVTTLRYMQHNALLDTIFVRSPLSDMAIGEFRG